MNIHNKLLVLVIFTLTVSTARATDVRRVSEFPELESSAHSVQITAIIESSIDEVWKAIAIDFDKNIKFNLDAVHALYIKNSSAKVGSQRRTLDQKNRYIDVEITEYLQDKKYIAWEIISTDVAKIEVAFSSYQLESIDMNKTKITQEAGFKLSNPIMQVAAKRLFPDLFRTEIAVLKHTLENGVGKDDLSKSGYKNRYFKKIKIERLVNAVP